MSKRALPTMLTSRSSEASTQASRSSRARRRRCASCRKASGSPRHCAERDTRRDAGAQAMIELRDIGKTYKLGDERVCSAHGRRPERRAQRVRRAHGRIRLGQVDAHEHLGCLDMPSAGTYSLDGDAVAGLNEDQLARVRNRKIGFIFQNFYLMPRVTALDNVAQPLIYRGLSPVRCAGSGRAKPWTRVGLADEAASQAERAVRRTAPARGHRARAGRASGLAAGRRADRQSRQPHGREIMALLHGLNAEGQR